MRGRQSHPRICRLTAIANFESKLEAHSRQGRGAFQPNAVQLVGVHAESIHDGRRYLQSSNFAEYRTRIERWIREQQHYVHIVMRKAAVLLLLRSAAGVN